MIYKCFFCRLPISATNGFLEFYDERIDKSLTYPSNGLNCGIIPVLSHAKCGPDCGYAIELRRIWSDGVHHWRQHLIGKTWYDHAVASALNDAYNLYPYLKKQDLQPKHKGKQNRQVQTYVIQRGENGPVKIGLAVDVLERVRTFQTACVETLKIIRTFSGNREREFHLKFSALRIRGEWFCAEVLVYLENQ